MTHVNTGSVPVLPGLGRGFRSRRKAALLFNMNPVLSDDCDPVSARAAYNSMTRVLVPLVAAIRPVPSLFRCADLAVSPNAPSRRQGLRKQGPVS